MSTSGSSQILYSTNQKILRHFLPVNQSRKLRVSVCHARTPLLLTADVTEFIQGQSKVEFTVCVCWHQIECLFYFVSLWHWDDYNRLTTSLSACMCLEGGILERWSMSSAKFFRKVHPLEVAFIGHIHHWGCLIWEK